MNELRPFSLLILSRVKYQQQESIGQDWSRTIPQLVQVQAA